jgi:hypothetical protein
MRGHCPDWGIAIDRGYFGDEGINFRFRSF